MAQELLTEFILLLGGRSGQRVLDALLQRCRALTGAQAGILYVLRCSGGSRALVPVAAQNDAVSARPLRHDDLHPAVEALAARALDGSTAALADHRPCYPAGGCRAPAAFWSGLAIPLRNHAGDLVGALQLLDRSVDQLPAAFAPAQVATLTTVSSIIGDALERWDMSLRLAASNEELKRQTRDLALHKARIEALSEETEAALRTSVTLLAKAAELHDEDTGNHILRVNSYAETLAERLGLPSNFREEIGYSAALHDVGKMSVDAALLKKSGSLTLSERTEMERHTTYGYQILRQSERLHMAAQIAWAHHERWDGEGYPRGLAGDRIPLAARIVAVGDVYDALRSPRPYKTARSHAEATAWMLRGEGHFDPAVLSCFADNHQDFDSIYEKLVDRPNRPFR